VEALMIAASSRVPNRTCSSRRVDVLAVERRDERPVQTLDNLVGEEVALVFDFLDLVGLVPDRAFGRDHLLEEFRAAYQLVGERLKVAVELLFAGNQSQSQAPGL
jgi:hypothetical protein